MDSRAGAVEILDWGVAAVPLAGQEANGDLHVVAFFDGGALVAAIDALGHGPEAETSAQLAAQLLATSPHLPIGELLRRCHRALTGRRGVVASLAAFDATAGLLTWAGVGNVEAVLLRGAHDRPASRSGLVVIGGVVGGDLPELRPQQMPIERGDLVIFATDGVRREFVDNVDPRLPPQELAADLLQRHAKGTDDALVLAVRYRGEDR